jgi:pyridinium-3,5-bisthiocarboxylic acid mononucleotide nickel chelatase
MKRILYLDAFSGISGDMFVGALLDLGADLEAVRRDVTSLNLAGFEIRATKVSRQGIVGTKFDVLDKATHRNVDELPGHHGGHVEHYHEHYHEDAHHHGQHPQEERRHHGRGARAHALDENHLKQHGPHAHRSLTEIKRIISESSLSKEVAADAIALFQIIGRAEALVHGVEIDAVHFHEVGALDTIVDIVAAASALRQLRVDEVICSPVHVGSGTVRCAHGLLPVPAPATLEILKEIPIYSTEIRGELATPTGAALLRHFCGSFGHLPPLMVEAIGYGAGSKEREIPNLLRATLGTESQTKN